MAKLNLTPKYLQWLKTRGYTEDPKELEKNQKIDIIKLIKNRLKLK